MSSSPRTAPPNFSIEAACASCNTTLASLSEHIGIPQEELLAFSNGAVGPSARDWFAVMSHLTEGAPRVQRTDARRAAYRALNLASYKVLKRDVDEQDREENPE